MAEYFTVIHKWETASSTHAEVQIAGFTGTRGSRVHGITNLSTSGGVLRQVSEFHANRLSGLFTASEVIRIEVQRASEIGA